jgi:uncharacterized protein YgbK (DUF1537 family)
MVRVGIIADDYTGAADTGVQFAKKGLKTAIVRDSQRIGAVAERVDVLVITTESRADPAEVAHAKVASAAEEFKKAGVGLLYKKIDSTLRGNIGVELDAALNALNVPAAILCPAYPKTGRTTVGGWHYINNVLIEDTEIAADPESPVKESHIPTLIQSQSRSPVTLIDVSKVSEGVQRVADEVVTHLKQGSQIIVVDARSQGDLKVIAQALSALDQPLLICGSGGLAEELPDAFGLGSEQGDRVAVIAGSVSNVTAQQIRWAETALNVKVIQIDMHRVFVGETERSLEVSRGVEEVRDAFEAGRDVVVRFAESQRAFEAIREVGRRRGVADSEMRRHIGDVLGRIALAIVKDRALCGLVLTGGETAFNVYKALDVLEVEVEDEVVPGIPTVTIVGGPASGTQVVTKAGAFGDEDALVTAIEYLRKNR